MPNCLSLLYSTVSVSVTSRFSTVDGASKQSAWVYGAGCWAGQQVRKWARQAVARDRLSIEIRVDGLPRRDRLDRALNRERQRELVRVKRGCNLAFAAILVPAVLLAPGPQVVPLRRLRSFDPQVGRTEAERPLRRRVEIAVGIVAGVGKLDRRAPHAGKDIAVHHQGMHVVGMAEDGPRTVDPRDRVHATSSQSRNRL